MKFINRSNFLSREGKIYIESFRRHRTTSEQVWCDLGWGYLSAVTAGIRNIQVANKSATWSWRDFRNFWNRKKLHF